jgi:hypothetical protein
MMTNDIPVFEFEQSARCGGFKSKTEIWIDRDEMGLTIDAMIMVEYNPLLRNQVEQNVVAVLPDSEGIRLRDYLLSVYPIK